MTLMRCVVFDGRTGKEALLKGLQLIDTLKMLRNQGKGLIPMNFEELSLQPPESELRNLT